MSDFKYSNVQQPDFLDRIVDCMKEVSDVEFSFPKFERIGRNEARVVTTVYETVALTWEKEKDFRNRFYEFCKENFNKVVAIVDYETHDWNHGQNIINRYSEVELKLVSVDIKKRSKQSSIKVNSTNFRKVLEEYADPGQGKFLFGKNKYGQQLGDIAILVEGKVRHYDIPFSGLFVKLSQELSVGKSSQEVINQYYYVEFDL